MNHSDQTAFQTISHIRFGDSLDKPEFTIPKIYTYSPYQYLNDGDRRLFGPFTRKIILKGQLIKLKIMMAYRTFLLEEQTSWVGVYLYQWNDDLDHLNNLAHLNLQKPDAVFPFSETVHLAKQIHKMSDDNDYTYPEFQSIFHETPIEELVQDHHLILNFCLIEWDFRMALIQLNRDISEKSIESAENSQYQFLIAPIA